MNDLRMFMRDTNKASFLQKFCTVINALAYFHEIADLAPKNDLLNVDGHGK